MCTLLCVTSVTGVCYTHWWRCALHILTVRLSCNVIYTITCLDYYYFCHTLYIIRPHLCSLRVADKTKVLSATRKLHKWWVWMVCCVQGQHFSSHAHSAKSVQCDLDTCSITWCIYVYIRTYICMIYVCVVHVACVQYTFIHELYIHIYNLHTLMFASFWQVWMVCCVQGQHFSSHAHSDKSVHCDLHNLDMYSITWCILCMVHIVCVRHTYMWQNFPL